MTVEPFEFGDTMSGLLIDGVVDTPYVSGVVSYDAKKGVRVVVPYKHDGETEQFSSEREWFDNGALPPNLQVDLREGEISLFGVHKSKQVSIIGRSLSFAEIAARVVVLKSREGEMSDELKLSQVRSHIDGLSEWTRFSSVTRTHETDENSMVKKLTLEVETMDALTWKQGDATMKLLTHWSTEEPEQGTQISDWVVLESEFDEPRPFSDHLDEQRKIVQLLTLLFGCGIRFRRHQIRDERFPIRMMDGSVSYLPFCEAYSDATTREITEPRPTREQLVGLIARVQDLGVEGLERWGAIHNDWRRVILPMVGVLSRAAFVEDVVINAAMSLEAAGHILGYREGEEDTYNGVRKTTATWMYRCVVSLGLDWSEIAESPMAVARGITNFYNDIKHYARGEFPDPEETYLIRIVAAVVVRMTVMNAIEDTGEIAKTWGEHWLRGQGKQQYKDRGVRIAENGRFVPRSS